VEQPETFFELGLGGIVLKKGSQGVEVITPGERFSLQGMRVPAIDSTGAGDSFAGGWMHALAHEAALRQAALLANACGALSTTFEGPHGTFSMEELQDFMATYKDNDS
jgi:sugar/nucleoside kinase (ribokinase family)